MGGAGARWARKKLASTAPAKSADGPGNGPTRGVAQSGPEDEQGGHGYPVPVGKAEVAVDFGAHHESDRETNGVGHCAGGGTALHQRAGGLLHGGTQGLVLVPEITRDQRADRCAVACRRRSRILEVRICRAPPAMTKPERTAAARGDAGKAEETSRKTTDCCPTQLTPGWRKESIP